MKKVEFDFTKKKNLKNSILVEGVNGVGNIANISVNYIIEKTGAELIARIYSNCFPNAVIVNEDSLIDLPHYSLYYKKFGNKKVLFLKGNFQPEDSYKNFEIYEKIVNKMKKEGVSEIITVAGIALHSAPEKIKLHCVTNNKSIQKKLKKYDLIFDGSKSVGLIIGMAGLLLGFSKRKNIDAFCILVSTWAHPNHLGVKESRRVIEFLSKYLNFEIDLKDINEDIKKINITKKELFKKEEKKKNRYIG